MTVEETFRLCTEQCAAFDILRRFMPSGGNKESSASHSCRRYLPRSGGHGLEDGI